jgi:MFS superfamily sulfate permease-like transporter
MVAMGTSLADRAWSRESAVFRITGVMSVIGGWFITAGVAFLAAYLMTNIMYFGSFVAMTIAVVISIALLIRSNMRYQEKKQERPGDTTFREMMHAHDSEERFQLLTKHISQCNSYNLSFVMEAYKTITDSFFQEEYRPLKRVAGETEEQRRQLKRQRRREIIGLRRLDPIMAVERNTWYFLMNNAVQQMFYCLKRINDPCREHVGNNFSPVDGEYVTSFIEMRNQILSLFERANKLLIDNTTADAELIRTDATSLQVVLSKYRKTIIDDIQKHQLNIETMTVYLNIVQESQEMLSALRHMLRGFAKYKG